MYLDNKFYDILKWIAQFLIPGLGALYFALSSIWGFPYGEEIVGTLMAIDIFLGALLGINAIEYQQQRVIQGDIPLAGRSTIMATGNSFFNLSSDSYERLKWFTLILLPAFGAFYVALSQLWGFPYGEQIVGTIAAIVSFLGVMLGISTYKYHQSLAEQ